jgi:hypothetical protein
MSPTAAAIRMWSRSMEGGRTIVSCRAYSSLEASDLFRHGVSKALSSPSGRDSNGSLALSAMASK